MFNTMALVLLLLVNTADGADFNGDRKIDFTDFLLFAQHFGTARGEETQVTASPKLPV